MRYRIFKENLAWNRIVEGVLLLGVTILNSCAPGPVSNFQTAELVNGTSFTMGAETFNYQFNDYVKLKGYEELHGTDSLDFLESSGLIFSFRRRGAFKSFDDEWGIVTCIFYPHARHADRVPSGRSTDQFPEKSILEDIMMTTGLQYKLHYSTEGNFDLALRLTVPIWVIPNSITIISSKGFLDKRITPFLQTAVSFRPFFYELFSENIRSQTTPTQVSISIGNQIKRSENLSFILQGSYTYYAPYEYCKAPSCYPVFGLAMKFTIPEPVRK